jgi:hypothetical protein
MKKKHFERKLTVNKQTIANLSKEKLNSLRGGYITFDCDTDGEICTLYAQCRPTEQGSCYYTCENTCTC